MSIKIDGTKNTISKIKDDNTNSVKVYKNLYVDDQLVDPNGEPSTNYIKISSNGIVDLTGYNKDNTVFQVRVSNYKDMSNVVKENGHKYYDITVNNRDISLSDLDSSYTDLFVNITNPSPEEPVEPGLPEKDDITITFLSASNITHSPYKQEVSFLGTVDYTNYDVQIKMFEIPINYSWKEGNGSEIYDWGEGTMSLFGSSTNFTGTVYTDTMNIAHSDHATTITANVTINSEKGTATLQIIRNSETLPNRPSYVSLSFNYNISSFQIVVSQTPKTQSSSTLSLRKSNVASSTSNYENLIVNNDALIQGNLTVNGYINDLKWYWDYINFDAPVINLGAGFLAKLIDINIVIDENTISIPTLQLSPGGIYTTHSYNISWKSDGNIIIESSEAISNITGLIQVLRYE